MKRFLLTPPRKLIRDIAKAVIVGLIAVAAIAGLINTYRYDSEARDRSRNTQTQLLAGCDRGNELRGQIGDIARSVKNLDLYIVDIFKQAIEHPSPNTTQDELAQTRVLLKKFQMLADDVRIPALQDCAKLFGNT